MRVRGRRKLARVCRRRTGAVVETPCECAGSTFVQEVLRLRVTVLSDDHASLRMTG